MTPPASPAAMRRWAALLAALGLMASCGGASGANAPTLPVVATMWPLAQLTSAIGGDRVTVVDLTTPGTNPRGAPVNAIVSAELGKAALIVDVGGGYQPALEAAIAAPGRQARVVSLYPALGGPSPAFWLDPQLMTRAVGAVTDALVQLNPVAAPAYRDKARDFDQTLQSLNIDYTSTLTACAHSTIVTTDDAFAGLAARYSLIDRSLQPGATDASAAPAAPDPAAVARATATIRAAGVDTVFAETLADNRLTDRAAAAAGVKERTLDTLSGPPPGGWPAGADYFALMESNLGAFSRSLKCASPDAQ